MDLNPDQWANLAMSAFMAAAAVVAVVVYHVTASWWQSPTGRHLMAMSIALTVLGAYTVVISAWPEIPVLRWVRAVLVGCIGLLMVQRTLLILSAQREERESRIGRGQGDGSRGAGETR